jgi:hypothetical protein
MNGMIASALIGLAVVVMCLIVIRLTPPSEEPRPSGLDDLRARNAELEARVAALEARLATGTMAGGKTAG